MKQAIALVVVACVLGSVPMVHAAMDCIYDVDLTLTNDFGKDFTQLPVLVHRLSGTETYDGGPERWGDDWFYDHWRAGLRRHIVAIQERLKSDRNGTSAARAAR